MPRISPFLDVVAGVGASVSLNRTTEIAARGNVACFLDPMRVLFQRQVSVSPERWALEVYNLATRETEPVPHGEWGASFLAARGGRWMAFAAGLGVYDATGTIWADAGLAGVGTDGRGAAGADGTIGFVQHYQAGRGLQLLTPNGEAIDLPDIAINTLSIYDRSLAVWVEGGQVKAWGRRDPAPQAEPVSAVRVVQSAGQWFLLVTTDTRLILRRWDAAEGTVVVNGPTAFAADAALLNPTTIRVVSSRTVGERPEDIETHDVAIADLPLPANFNGGVMNGPGPVLEQQVSKKKLGGWAAVIAAIAAAVALAKGGGSKPNPQLPTPNPAPASYTLTVRVYRGPVAGDHKLPGAAVDAGDVHAVADGAGNANLDGLPAGQHNVCARAAGYVPTCAAVTVPGGPLDLSLERDVPPTLPVRIDRRSWVTDAGTFRPVFQSGLSLLVRSPAERAAFLDQTRAIGFNGIRVFAGDLGWAGQTPAAARAALHPFLDEAAARGLYVYVCAITGGRDPAYDIEAHLRDVAAIVAVHPNAILEVENEIGHPTLSDRGNDVGWLLGMARRSIPAGVLWTLGAPVGTDEPTPEGTYEADGGQFNDAHLDRGRDLYNQVRRLREIAAISEATRKPAMSGEPIGIAEVPMPGKQRLWGDDARRFAFAYGVLCRGFELGCVFHSEQGLHAEQLGPQTTAAAEDFIAGWKAIDTPDRLAFVNAGWPGSPIRGANFDTGIVRAYSFIAGDRGWTVLVGLRGDPAVEWGGGWHPVKAVADRPGVRVIEIAR